MNNIALNLLLTAGGIILLALLIIFIRFLIGKTLTDKVIAFDTFTVGSLGLIALLSVFENREIYLDVNIIYGLLSFVAVVIVGKYIEKTL